MTASKLKMARVALGLSQEELGKSSGCSRALISMIENSYVLPQPATAARLAKALGQTEAFLFGAGPEDEDDDE